MTFCAAEPAPAPAPVVALASYDVIVVAFSGGKDSLACLLHLLEQGVPREKIELWHHDVDGQEGSTLMDWACTRDYCRKVAAAFGVPIYFSWKKGGIEGEMLRDDAPTAGYAFETPDGLRFAGGTSKNRNTRLMFPQVSADLSVRWCSAYAKIMVMDAAIRGQERFNGVRTLVVTGERAEESASRAKYEIFEPHRADLRDGRKPRHVDQLRAVHAWSEAEVWAIIARWLVNPHPAYRLGWGRVSCAACIFGSPAQWASLRAVNPAQFNAIAAYETRFGKTIKRKLNVIQTADAGVPYAMSERDVAAALSHTFAEPVFMAEWVQPAGAFGESCGPT
ncbi:MAG: phosphoadenosine phosphosulfate reductase [Rhodocyclaceae bacterium]|nr:MAG: phosphoadenosine phosphosulfate reductase [Rhodocyclaceae bacterium]